jgi:hypothetical protein
MHYLFIGLRCSIRKAKKALLPGTLHSCSFPAFGGKKGGQPEAEEMKLRLPRLQLQLKWHFRRNRANLITGRSKRATREMHDH